MQNWGGRVGAILSDLLLQLLLDFGENLEDGALALIPWFGDHAAKTARITSYNVCYTKLLRGAVEGGFRLLVTDADGKSVSRRPGSDRGAGQMHTGGVGRLLLVNITVAAFLAVNPCGGGSDG